MYELFPELKSFSELDREEHVDKILSSMCIPKSFKSKVISSTISMFDYMYFNKLSDAPTYGLITKYDRPKDENVLPRPIPPDIKVQLDDYIESKIIPLLESGMETPIVEAKFWDLIIIIRNTGRRFEDICHLIAEHEEKNRVCLQYDLDGDPMLFLDHHIAKIPKDLRIPLAHLNDANNGNVVEKAILRQMERVKDLPPAPDGYKYLFREIKKNYRGRGKGKVKLNSDGTPVVDSLEYSFFNVTTVLPKICNQIPLKNIDGSIYKITAHQFRHTVATEMIDAGVDVYAVKEFLGHFSVAMTERYIKVYQQKLKKEFNNKLNKSDATDVKNTLLDPNELYTNKWTKNKIKGVFELGDGCCEHLYKMPSCPHMACKTCFKKKIYPRHMKAVKDTIESTTIHKDNAINLGLTEKVDEFDKIIRFYKTALDIISKGEIFDASKDFYKGGQ